MRYRGLINIDYTKQDSNSYSRLKVALIQAGWLFVETSAFVIESDNLSVIWRGIELVAKQSSAIGDLSALTFHIQGSNDFTTSLSVTSTQSGPNALSEIKALPFP